jgi:hypothetical protein
MSTYKDKYIKYKKKYIDLKFGGTNSTLDFKVLSQKKKLFNTDKLYSDFLKKDCEKIF